MRDRFLGSLRFGSGGGGGGGPGAKTHEVNAPHADDQEDEDHQAAAVEGAAAGSNDLGVIGITGYLQRVFVGVFKLFQFVGHWLLQVSACASKDAWARAWL